MRTLCRFVCVVQCTIETRVYFTIVLLHPVWTCICRHSDSCGCKTIMKLKSRKTRYKRSRDETRYVDVGVRHAFIHIRTSVHIILHICTIAFRMGFCRVSICVHVLGAAIAMSVCVYLGVWNSIHSLQHIIGHTHTNRDKHTLTHITHSRRIAEQNAEITSRQFWTCANA